MATLDLEKLEEALSDYNSNRHIVVSYEYVMDKLPGIIDRCRKLEKVAEAAKPVFHCLHSSNPAYQGFAKALKELGDQ